MAPPRKTDTALLAYDPRQRAYIYEIIDPTTNKAIYVGRTTDLARRAAEHARKTSKCSLLRETLRLASWKLSNPGVIRVIPEVAGGVPASRAWEFEGYFIEQRGTLYGAQTNLSGCNLKHGDGIASQPQDWFDRIKAEIANGVCWPEAPKEVVQEFATEEVLEAVVELVGDVDSRLVSVLHLARDARKQAERRHMSALALAEELEKDYRGRAPYEEVDRSLFERDVNCLRDRLNEEEKPDEKMLQLLRAVAFFGKSEGAEWVMRSKAAAGQLEAVAVALESREEARLPHTTCVKRMLEVRNWSAANDYRKPLGVPTQKTSDTWTVEEEKHAHFLHDWKRKMVEQDVGFHDFIMRNSPWWTSFKSYSRRDAGDETRKEANLLLMQGFGHRNEPEFEGKQGLGSTHNGKRSHIYPLIDHIVKGNATEETLNAVFAGIPPNRKNWYLEQWKTNRARTLAMQREQAKKTKVMSGKSRKGHAQTTPARIENECWILRDLTLTTECL